MSVLTLRCSDGSIECGSRFKYLDEEIPMNYKALTEAVGRAINKEAAEHDNKFITNERITPVPKAEILDYDALMTEFQTLAGELMTKSSSNGVKITSIVERYLGKGKKASEATPDQVEMLNLIILEMRDLNKWNSEGRRNSPLIKIKEELLSHTGLNVFIAASSLTATK